METVARCLASYFGNPGKFSVVFTVVFQASRGKKPHEKTKEKITELVPIFDANIQLLISCIFLKMGQNRKYPF